MANTVYFDRAHLGIKSDITTEVIELFVANNPTKLIALFTHPQTINSNAIIESGFIRCRQTGDGSKYVRLLLYEYDGTTTGSILAISSNELTISNTTLSTNLVSFPSNSLLTSGKTYVLGCQFHISGGTNGRIRNGTFSSHSTASKVITGISPPPFYTTLSGSIDYTSVPSMWLTYTGGVTTTGLSEQRMMLVPTSDDFIGYVGTGTTSPAAETVGGSGTHYSFIDEWETLSTSNWVWTSGTANTKNFYNISIPTGSQSELGKINAVRIWAVVTNRSTLSTNGTLINLTGFVDTGDIYAPQSSPNLAILMKEYRTNPFSNSVWSWANLSSLKIGHIHAFDDGFGTRTHANWLDVFYMPYIPDPPPTHINRVSGGVFVNVSNLVRYNITSYYYSNFTDSSVTISNAYPYTFEQYIVPSIIYGFDSSIKNGNSLGQNYGKYKLNYILDIVGRTRQERDFYTDMTIRSLEKGKTVISGVGNLAIVSFDNLGTYRIVNENQQFECRHLMVKMEFEQFVL